MSDYIKTTDFLAKDSLAVGNANKVIKGAEFEVEFDAIAAAIATKAEPATALTAALAAAYPIGSVYINVTATSPATLFGFGTWAAFGAGRVMVGLDAGDASFDTLEEVGGSKDAIVVAHTHTGTTASSGSHAHNLSAYHNGGSYGQGGGADPNQRIVSLSSAATDSQGAHTHTITTDSTGAAGTDANLQPYIVVHMWKRTA